MRRGLRHIDKVKDRLRPGQYHYYFRPEKGGARIALPDTPDIKNPSDEFVAAYRLAAAPFALPPPEGRGSKLKRKAVTHGAIYLLRFRDWVKIGFTTNMATRLGVLQTSLPEKAVLLATVPGLEADEKALHSRFKAYRAHGEWFRFEGEVKDWAESLV